MHRGGNGVLLLLAALAALSQLPERADAHGRLIEPPSRSTMWRYGFTTPPNYNDHELYCGGFSRQWRTNGGKCGICGDPWDVPQVIKVRVELTANHMGYFEFRLCPNNKPTKPASQACLDLNLLQNANSRDTRYYPGPGNKVFEMHYQLPKGLTCRQCVFQWRYVAGNNWGTCKNGTGAVGCGPQEEFRACADVTITEPDGSADSSPNSLQDEEVYVPGHNSEGTSESPEDDADDATPLTDEIGPEGIIIVVLASLLFVVLFFLGLFFYYTRGKAAVQRYVQDKDWDLPSMPSLPSMPKLPKVKKAVGISWPLASAGEKIGKLPQFMHKGGGKKKAEEPKREISAPISAPVPVAASTPLKGAPQPNGVPRPPPRVKKHAPSVPQQAPESSRLATISTRPHAGGAVTRPSAPPPVVPPPAGTTIEISTPTAVTINGVTVTNASTEDQLDAAGIHNTQDVSVAQRVHATAQAQTHVSVVPARPAIADEDLPDSLQSAPPLPDCPPPDSFEDVTLK